MTFFSVILAQTPQSLDGAVDLIQLGFVGIALLWFALGKVFPESTVKDLREQLKEEKVAREAESKDAKAVRDAIIKDVAPAMVLQVEQSKEFIALTERLLALVSRMEEK
jgi:hypothetical protein